MAETPPLTIVLSGPKSAEPQARTALAAAGFAVDASGHDHGLPDHPVEGKKLRQVVSFLTVEADDVDAVASSAKSVKYVVRMHHERIEPAPASTEQYLLQELAALRAEVAELRAAA